LCARAAKCASRIFSCGKPPTARFM
jgi:hypothetical protein